MQTGVLVVREDPPVLAAGCGCRYAQPARPHKWIDVTLQHWCEKAEGVKYMCVVALQCGGWVLPIGVVYAGRLARMLSAI